MSITISWRASSTMIRNIEVYPDDSSFRYRAISKLPELTLKFSLDHYEEIPVGAWCVYQGQRFYLNVPQNLKKNGTRNIEYTITMGTKADTMMFVKFRNMVDKRIKFSMCAKPHEFIDEIVANLNEREGSELWSRGTCLEENEKTIEFNHQYILDALASVASEFDTEFEITEDYKINLCKCEKFKDSPLELSYGRGNGFVPGLGRTTQSDKAPISRLYISATDRNINRAENFPSLYGATPQTGDTTTAELRLPSTQVLRYDGSHFGYINGGSETGFDPTKEKRYRTDRTGSYIERIYPTTGGTREESLDCSEIYPSYYGNVANVTLGTESGAREKHFYDFTDPQTPIDFNDYILEGETMTVIFQSGMLSGKEFEVKYNHAEHKWKVVPQEIDGILMPDPDPPEGSGYIMHTGDKYAVFNIMLPPAYICNNGNHTGASWDMFREAVRYLWDNEDQKFTFTGEIQGKWAKENWSSLGLGERLAVGSYIRFTDTQFCPSGVDIRIVGIKDYINKFHAPTIELSNTGNSASYASSKFDQIDKEEVVTEDKYKQAVAFSKRRYRDAKDTIEGLRELMLEGFTDAVSPISVQTMSMLVGDESLQFQFLDSSTGEIVNDVVSIEGNIVKCKACKLRHMTLGINSITSSAGREGQSHRTWTMNAYDSGTLTDTSRLYLYANVRQILGGNGTFSLSLTPLPLKSGSGIQAMYNLLVGIVNAEIEGERSFAPLYGFTEVLPGRITTDLIASADGNSYLNLASGSMQLGEKLKYINDVLTLDFLIAENAKLAGWTFRDNRLYSENNSCYLDGVNGKIQLNGIITNQPVTITQENFDQYVTKTAVSGGYDYNLNLPETGEVIVIEYWPTKTGGSGNDYYINLPGLDGKTSKPKADKMAARKYLGRRITIYNSVGGSVAQGIQIAVVGQVFNMVSDRTYDQDYMALPLQPGVFIMEPLSFATYECRVRRGVSSDGHYTNFEEIYWCKLNSGRSY